MKIILQFGALYIAMFMSTSIYAGVYAEFFISGGALTLRVRKIYVRFQTLCDKKKKHIINVTVI